MTSLLESQLRSNDLAPIFLGYSAYTSRIARQLFHRYHLISHVFCERVSFFQRCSPIMKFHRISGFTHDELLLTALEDFADAVRNQDVVLYLINGTKTAAEWIARHRERLETRFVVANSDTIRNLHEIPSLR